MDFRSWKKRDVKIDALNLDPQNPRVPDTGRQQSLRDEIAALISREEVYELARDIVRAGGLYPSDSLIAVAEGNEWVVMEGNRRLSALKLLDNPDLAPEEHIKKFRTLKEEIPPEAIERVSVVFAPSREAAAPIIVDRHTGQAVKRWARDQQVKFIRTLMTPGHTIEEIATRIHMTPGEISKALRFDMMLQLTRVATISPEVRNAIADPRTLNYSIVERLTEMPVVLKSLGIKFDSVGNVVGNVDEAEFKKGYGRILTDIVKGPSKGGIDTRTIGTVQDAERYLQTLGTDIPDKRKKGTFTSASLLAGSAPLQSTPSTSKPQNGPVVTKGSAYLPSRTFKLKTTNQRIKDVFNELRRLKVADFEDTCAVMIRIFFEMLITNYLETNNKVLELIAQLPQKAKDNIKNQSSFHPSMKQMLFFIMKDAAITIQPQARRRLDQMISQDADLLSFEAMNVFVHNIHSSPREKDLRRLWGMLEPLMAQLMA